MTRKTSTKGKAKRTTAPKRKARQPRARTAPTGDAIEKLYKGKTIRVTKDADGFHFDGKVWRSLTAIALAVTGYKAISGPAFFDLTKKAERGGE